MGNLLRYLIFLFFTSVILVNSLSISGQEKSGNIVLYEGFENGIPSGWVQEFIESPDGFNANWNTRKGAGWISGSIYGDPDTAAVGQRNLVFQWEGIGHITNLITSPVDLEFIVFPELSFYHAQNIWGPDGPDQLWIHYREGEEGEWKPLTSKPFTAPVPHWTHRVYQLPSGSDKFYLRLQGTSLYGMGVCIDELTITETGIIPRELSWIQTSQALTGFVSTGSKNNPILRSQVRVTGNTGDLKLQTFSIKSSNTSDADIAPSGIKLYFTDDEVFHASNLVGTATAFVNGEAVFTNLNLDLPTGYSYLWLTFDVDDDATQGNFLDAYIPANGIVVSGGPGYTLPETNQDPPGRREIFKTIFRDDYETDKGWELTGEWEIDIPQGLGGSYGFPGPSNPFIGNRILGTDLTGQGDFHGDYEPGLDSLAYQAISPEFDCFYYTNVVLSFNEWLNIEFSDRIFIHTSIDGGSTWNRVWQNTNFFSATDWGNRSLPIPGVNRKEKVKIRFSLGPTDNNYNYSGWNIDNLVVTGTYVTRDVGVAEWIGPDGGCGMTNNEKITVRIENYGAGPITGPIPVKFSLNNGQTWHTDVVNQNIPVGGSVIHTFSPGADFSAPGRYNNIIVKTELEGDQDTSNDALIHKLFSVPTYTPPYTQNFVNNDGLWTGYGQNSSWMRGIPQGTHINGAYSGLHAWITNAAGPYNSNEASWLESPCFDLSALENPVLEFYLNHHTAPGMDGVSVQYTLDQGENWSQISLLDNNFAWNWYGAGTVAKLDEEFGQPQGWHGSSGGWKRVRAVMDDQIALKTQVKFRLIFASDDYPPGANPWEGVAFDAVSIYQAPHDVGVADLMNPFSTCELSTQESVTIMIENHGFNTIEAGTVIPVGVDVNELSPVYENKVLETDLAPGATTTFTFETKFDLSEEKDHVIIAYTMLPGDTDFYFPGVYNDTLYTQITVFGYPEFSLGEDIYTLLPDTVVIDAGAGYQAYLWDDGSNQQTFEVTSIFTSQYSVTVTDFNNCSSSADIMVIAYDLEIVAITEPVSDCELSDSEFVKVEIKNSGPDIFAPGTEISLELYLETSLYDEHLMVLSDPLLPGASVYHSFSRAVDFSGVGEYRFIVLHNFKDADPLNNVLNQSVFVHGYPVPLIPDTLYSASPVGIQLDAGSEFIEFLWQDGFTGQIYEITSEYNSLYEVNIVDQFGCPGYGSTLLIGHDVELIAVKGPVESCELSVEEPVGIVFRNNGPSAFPAGHNISFVVELNGVKIFEEDAVLTNSLNVGEEMEYVFVQTADMKQAGTYEIRIYQKHRDAIPDNDTTGLTVVIHGYPDLVMPPYVVTDHPETVLLDAGSGFASYLWQDNSTGQTYQVSMWDEYWVEVTNDFGCITRKYTRVVPELFDLAVVEIVSPVNFCMNSDGQPVEILVQNSGFSEIPAGTSFGLSFLVNNAQVLQQQFTLASPMEMSESRSFTFPGTWTSSQSGSFMLTAKVDFLLDEIPDNNTHSGQITVYASPVPDFGGDVYTLSPDTVVLEPKLLYTSYLWQDGSTSPYFNVQSPNTTSYQLTVTDHNGCAGSSSVRVITYDLQMQQIISPKHFCEFTNQEKIHVKIQNVGLDDIPAGEKISVGFRRETQPIVLQEFILAANWSANTSREFLFTNTVDLTQTSRHNIMAYVATAMPTHLLIPSGSQIELKPKPVMELGGDIYTTRLDTVVLDAGYGFASYLWHDGITTQQYPVTTYGWKWVTVHDEWGCMTGDTIFVGQFVNTENIIASSAVVNIYPNPAKDILNIDLGGCPMIWFTLRYTMPGGCWFITKITMSGVIR
jgi:hypothetical protein